MKLIAHRGLVQGPDSLIENHPDQIQTALDLGFECEIDLWRVNGEFFLGHDKPHYPVPDSFVAHPKIWIHAKNVEALYYLSCHANKYHFFWHENDAFACTNRGFIWTYPRQALTPLSVCVMPELHMPLETVTQLTCYAICSDHVQEITALLTS